MICSLGKICIGKLVFSRDFHYTKEKEPQSANGCVPFRVWNEVGEHLVNRQSAAVGILVLAVGLFILLGKLGVFAFIGSVFWPLFILIPGVLLHVLYFGRMIPSVALIPAGILTVVSVVLMIGNWFGWGLMKYLWPLFPFAVAVGLYEYYIFGYSRSRQLWAAAAGLGAVSALMFVMTLLWAWGVYLFAVLLIGFGVWLVLRRPRIW